MINLSHLSPLYHSPEIPVELQIPTVEILSSNEVDGIINEFCAVQKDQPQIGLTPNQEIFLRLAFDQLKINLTAPVGSEERLILLNVTVMVMSNLAQVNIRVVDRIAFEQFYVKS